MSIANLAAEAFQQRRPRPPVVFQVAELPADSGQPEKDDDSQNENPPDKDKDDASKSALEALTHYIPTEIVTLYVATLAAKPALKTLLATWFPSWHPSAIWIYWFFAAATPSFFSLVFLSESYKHTGKPPPTRGWPWWQTFASTVAFLVWGMSVPTNPVLGQGVLPAVAGVFALVLSVFLDKFDPIFDPSKRDPKPGG